MTKAAAAHLMALRREMERHSAETEKEYILEGMKKPADEVQMSILQKRKQAFDHAAHQLTEAIERMK